MKPILVALNRQDSPSLAQNQNFTLKLYRILHTLGIPYEIKDASDATIDTSLYSAAIMPIAKTNNVVSRAWLNGSKAVPVVAHGQTPMVNDTNCTIGATASTGVAVSNLTATDENGNSIYYQGATGGSGANYAQEESTLDPADTLVDNYITSATGKSLMWRRRHATGNDVYYYRLENPLLWVLTSLNAAGITPNPYRLRIDIDDPDGMVTGSGAGVTAMAAWLRARSAVAICGLNNVEGQMPADIKALFLANTDVFRFIAHDHIGNPWRDDTGDLASVAGKIAAHDARVAELEALGFPIDSAGPHGHWYNPWNTATPTGWNALAKIGVTVPRALLDSGGSPVNTFGTNEIIWQYREGANAYRFRSMKRFSSGLTVQYDRKLIADAMADAGATGDAAKYGRVVQADVLTHQVILNDMPNIVFHGTNVENDDGALSDNPAVNFLDLMDAYVQRSGGWLKWAGMDDLAVMAGT